MGKILYSKFGKAKNYCDMGYKDSCNFIFTVDSDGYLHSYNFEPVEDKRDESRSSHYYIHGKEVSKEYMDLLKNRTEMLNQI